MTRALRRSLSSFVGWLSDRRIPTRLRAPLFRIYARATGADLSEAELPPEGYASFSAFFVRRLRAGVRPIDDDLDKVISPCDGTLLALDVVRTGVLFQAKGRSYRLRELLADSAREADLEGGAAFTIYLGPRDYHRVHAPLDAALADVRWIGGDRRSVAPRVLQSRERVLAGNERVVLRLQTSIGPWYLVMVGALNVGRIRVVGVEPNGAPRVPIPVRKGAELARFELGSTVVLLSPPGRVEPLPGLWIGAPLRMGTAIASLVIASTISPE